MPLLNYTTGIKTEKTSGEIQAKLAEFGAQGVMSEFQDKVLTAISFRIDTKFGFMSYRLPARLDNVYKILLNDRSVPRKFKTMEQASRVSWRIIKDWICAQLALIEAEQADVDQVFLPYMQVADGKTVYECMTTDSIKLLN